MSKLDLMELINEKGGFMNATNEHTFEDRFRWAAGDLTDAIAGVKYNGMKDEDDYWSIVNSARELLEIAKQYAEDEGVFDEEDEFASSLNSN